MRNFVFFLIFSIVLSFSSALFAQSAGKMVAIQAKKYDLKHEVDAGVGFLPLSAYYKGFTMGASYTYHFSDFYGWRVFNFQYVKNISTGLKDSLENNFGVTPATFSKIKFYVHTDFVITPLYRKMILFNRMVLHGETFFLIGAGAFKFGGQKDLAGTAPENGKFKPAIDIGVGFRIWLTEWLSTRLDVTHYLYHVSGSDFDNVLYVGLNLAVNFPLRNEEK